MEHLSTQSFLIVRAMYNEFAPKDQVLLDQELSDELRFFLRLLEDFQVERKRPTYTDWVRAFVRTLPGEEGASVIRELGVSGRQST